MVKYKMLCAYCGKKCDMEKDYCIPQDSVYVCKNCYEKHKLSNTYPNRDISTLYRDLIGEFCYYDEPLSDLIRKKEK